MPRKKNELAPKTENAIAEAETPAEYNKRKIAFALGLGTLSQNIDDSNPENLWQAFLKYAELCGNNNFPIENLSAYSAIGITKREADDWKSGKGKGESQQFRELIETIDRICATYRSIAGMAGDIAPSITIWRDKNFDNMSDEPAQLATPKDDRQRMSPQAIATKYKDILD